MIVLASASPARAAMLRAAGVVFDVAPARVDEEAVRAALDAEGAPARDVAEALAELKALRGSASAPGALAIGADQTLELAERRFDKPASRAEAADQLRALRGERHALHSAAVVALNGAAIWRASGRAALTVRPFSDAFLETYLDAAGEAVLGCVGGYQVEGLGAQLFSRIEGDHFTIMGLPLLELLGFLRARGELVE